MATTCNYGQFLNQALRDRLIAGLREESLIKKLLAKPKDMSFTQACKICLDYETVSAESKVVKNEGLIQKMSQVSKIKNQREQQGPKKTKTKSEVQRPVDKGKCTRCGRSQHKAYDCSAWKQQWSIMGMFQLWKQGSHVYSLKIQGQDRNYPTRGGRSIK